MKIIKRDGKEADFNRKRIEIAISKANMEVNESDRLTDDEIEKIAKEIEETVMNALHTFTVEEIQDSVEDHINDKKKFVLGRAYSQYRFKHAMLRKKNTTDDSIMSLIDCNNEEIKQENSNKNSTVNNVQRDYMAGEVSKDITKRYLLPEDIWRAHEEGIIHFHDSDYFAQKMSNCCLVNLEDMLQNGTVISDTMIEKPHSFSTACNIMTQIMAQVASSQYGGQSMSIAHIAPFVDVSRKKIRKKVEKELEGLDVSVKKKEEITESRVLEEINKGVQMIQYQAITLNSTNGQAPFVTLFMYIDEVPEGRTRDDLVLIIEEILKQRYKGVKNEKGAWVTPAFPKLIYVLDEDNIIKGSKYHYLTKLAAQCTARRLVPDYISAKVMKRLKKGNVYPVMGCRSALTVEDNVKSEDGTHKFYGRLTNVCWGDLKHCERMIKRCA